MVVVARSGPQRFLERTPVFYSCNSVRSRSSGSEARNRASFNASTGLRSKAL